MIQLVLYGSNVADTAIPTANEMAFYYGGSEVQCTTATSPGAGNFMEAQSSNGGTVTPVSAIPATPTGHGWTYFLGEGIVTAGNWSAVAKLTFNAATDLTMRFFQWSSGVYTLIGSITAPATTGGLQSCTFAANAFAQTAFGALDQLYIDLWLQDPGGAYGNFVDVYQGSSATAGVAGDMQVTIPSFSPVSGDPVIYGSATPDTTLTTASVMSLVAGGVEVGKTTIWPTGGGTYGEIFSQGTSSGVSVSAIPATPTGNGWVWNPGGPGTFSNGFWSAIITGSGVGGGTATVRFFRWSGGVYTLIGTIGASWPSVRTANAFANTVMPAATFATNDLLYIDLWFHDASLVGGDNPTVYESTSSAAGVASDMQITTATFTPAAGVIPPYIPRAFTGTRIMNVQPLYIPRAFTGTRIRSNVYPQYIMRAFTGTRIKAVPAVALTTTLVGVGTLSETLSLSTALTTTMSGVGSLTGTMSANTPLAVTLPGVGTLAATFSLATNLTDTLVGVGTLTPTLSANVPLAVTMSGTGTLTPTLTASTALSTTLSGSGTLIGTTSLTTALSTTIAGAGTLTATLSEATALAVTLSGVGTLTGTFSLATALTVTLVGVGQLLPTLSTTGSVSLTVTMSGVGTLIGTFSLSTALTTTIQGIGTLSGTTSLSVALSVTFAGIGAIGPITHIPLTYYASPGDNLQTKASVLLPGDTLLLNDGTYLCQSGQPGLRIQGIHGTAGSLITIKAAHDGAAIIDGQNGTAGSYEPLWITNSSYVWIEGLHLRNSYGNVIYIFGGTGGPNGPCSHITFKRVTAHGTGSGNVHCFNTDSGGIVGGLQYITYEDCAAWGQGRYMFLMFEVQFGVMRRCFGYWDTINNNIHQPRVCFGTYNSQHTIIENCVGRHAIPQPANTNDVWDSNYYDGAWGDSNDTTNFPNDYTHYFGCVFYNNWEAAHVNETTGLDMQFTNCYFETPLITQAATTSTTQGCGLWSDDPNTFSLTNCTFRNSVVGFHEGVGATGTFTNVAFVGNATAVSGTITHSNCGFYGNTANGLTPGGSDVTSDPGYLTATYGRGGALFVPSTSSYHGAGTSGADIGANILYQYASGVLTNIPLWPLPIEDRVVAELGISPTYDIWTTLVGVYGLAATMSGVGTLSPSLSANVALTDTLAGVGTLSATTNLTTALSTTLSGVGTLTGTTSLKTALSVTMQGVGTLSGTLSIAGQAALSVTMSGNGQLSATMAASTALSVTMAGSGTLSGVFSVRCALSLTFIGAGTLSGSLSIPILSYLTATWVTRDGLATWITRDNTVTWTTRDEKASWLARARSQGSTWLTYVIRPFGGTLKAHASGDGGDSTTWTSRDGKTTWKTRS